MLVLQVDENTSLLNIHPNSAQELFELVERNRTRLSPWVIPYFLPENYKDARQLTIHGLFDYYGSPTGPSELDQYFLELDGYFPDGNISLILEIRYQTELIGIMQMANEPDAIEAFTFGYWITQEYEGKGIITRSLNRLMEYVLDNMPVHRFTIFCATENRRSRVVPERLGYRLHVIRPGKEQVGEFVYDQAVYGISASDFKRLIKEKLLK